MPVRFVVVPEWQGSGSSRAMRLVDGAEALRGDLPAATTTVVDVPLEAGDSEGTGIARFSSLRVTRQRFAQAVEHLVDPLVTIGGDCAAEYAAVARTAAEAPALVWFDAHPDAHTPQSSPSRDFNGMVLRTLVDDGHVDPARIVLVGTRVRDGAEDAWIAEHGIPVIEVDRLGDPDALLEAVAATGASSVYLHVDVDVLDPAELDGVADPQPFGLGAAEAVAAIRAVRSRYPLAGAGLVQFSPASAAAASDDLGTLLRVVGALASGVEARGAETPDA